jgi:acetylornithine deacetylase
VLPGWDLAARRAEIERRVADAAAAHPALRARPPEVVWSGFLAEGCSFEGHREIEDLLARAHRETVGDGLGERLMTALTDTRFYALHHGIPAFTYGAVGEAIHGFDERVELASLERLTETIALFVAGWCGVRPRGG